MVEGIEVLSCFNFYYPADKIIKDLKYNEAFFNAKIIADLIYENHKEELKKADFLIPVPASIVSRFKKNYNPPSIIANHLHKKVLHFAFKKKVGKSQVGLSRKERMENMKDTFIPTKKLSQIQNKNIIIIDDTITTGATVSSLAREIKKFNPTHVKAICFTFKEL